MKKGIQATRGIPQEKEQLEDTITLANVARRLRFKNFSVRAAVKKTCGGMTKNTILADTLKVLIWAIFLESDAGFGVIRPYIGTWF